MEQYGAEDGLAGLVQSDERGSHRWSDCNRLHMLGRPLAGVKRFLALAGRIVPGVKED
jgi:hypothetical protein